MVLQMAMHLAQEEVVEEGRLTALQTVRSTLVTIITVILERQTTEEEYIVGGGEGLVRLHMWGRWLGTASNAFCLASIRLPPPVLLTVPITGGGAVAVRPTLKVEH